MTANEGTRTRTVSWSGSGTAGRIRASCAGHYFASPPSTTQTPLSSYRSTRCVSMICLYAPVIKLVVSVLVYWLCVFVVCWLCVSMTCFMCVIGCVHDQ